MVYFYNRRLRPFGDFLLNEKQIEIVIVKAAAPWIQLN